MSYDMLHAGAHISHQARCLSMPAAADAAMPSSAEAKQAIQLPEYPRRTGVIAIKVGMTQEWDQWGIRLPLTVLWIDDCQANIRGSALL
jgi:hypothetical protein